MEDKNIYLDVEDEKAKEMIYKWIQDKAKAGNEVAYAYNIVANDLDLFPAQVQRVLEEIIKENNIKEEDVTRYAKNEFEIHITEKGKHFIERIDFIKNLEKGSVLPV